MTKKRLKKKLMGLGIGRNLAEILVRNTWREYGRYCEEDYEYFKTLWTMYKKGLL